MDIMKLCNATSKNCVEPNQHFFGRDFQDARKGVRQLFFSWVMDVHERVFQICSSPSLHVPCRIALSGPVWKLTGRLIPSIIVLLGHFTNCGPRGTILALCQGVFMELADPHILLPYKVLNAVFWEPPLIWELAFSLLYSQSLLHVQVATGLCDYFQV